MCAGRAQGRSQGQGQVGRGWALRCRQWLVSDSGWSCRCGGKEVAGGCVPGWVWPVALPCPLREGDSQSAPLRVPLSAEDIGSKSPCVGRPVRSGPLSVRPGAGRWLWPRGPRTCDCRPRALGLRSRSLAPDPVSPSPRLPVSRWRAGLPSTRPSLWLSLSEPDLRPPPVPERPSRTRTWGSGRGDGIPRTEVTRCPHPGSQVPTACDVGAGGCGSSEATASQGRGDWACWGPGTHLSREPEGWAA